LPRIPAFANFQPHASLHLVIAPPAGWAAASIAAHPSGFTPPPPPSPARTRSARPACPPG
jgi:hypothetical protein